MFRIYDTVVWNFCGLKSWVVYRLSVLHEEYDLVLRLFAIYVMLSGPEKTKIDFHPIPSKQSQIKANELKIYEYTYRWSHWHDFIRNCHKFDRASIKMAIFPHLG